MPHAFHVFYYSILLLTLILLILSIPFLVNSSSVYPSPFSPLLSKSSLSVSYFSLSNSKKYFFLLSSWNVYGSNGSSLTFVVAYLYFPHNNYRIITPFCFFRLRMQFLCFYLPSQYASLSSFTFYVGVRYVFLSPYYDLHLTVVLILALLWRVTSCIIASISINSFLFISSK